MTDKNQHLEYDWIQINMSNFSMRALILGHHKTGTQISQPIFELFLKFNIPLHNLLFELCNGVLFIKNVFTFAFQNVCPFCI